MRSIASLVFVPLAFLAPAALAQKPKDLDKIVPPDSLVRVEADSFDSIKKAIADFVDGVMPGMGQMMIEGQAAQITSQPGISELDTTAPLSFTLLASGDKLIAATLKNPDAFLKAVKDMGDDGDTRVVAGEGASLVTLGKEVKVDDLAKAGRAKPPAEPGTVRGFLNLKDLYTKYQSDIEGALAMMQMMAAQGGGTPPDFGAALKSLAASAPRVDFSLTPSKSSLEIATAFTPAPDSKGVIATIAKAAPSSGSNKYLAALPAGCVMAASGRANPDMQAGFFDVFTTMFKAEDADKAKMKAWAEKILPLLSGEIAVGFAPSADGSAFAIVFAGGCTDKEKHRALMQEGLAKDGPIMKMMASMMKGVNISAEYKKAAETVDGAEVDQAVYTVDASGATDPAAKRAGEMLKKMYAEPVRIAYPAGSVVAFVGAGGSEAVKTAMTALKSGSVGSPAAKAVPTGAPFAAAVNLVDYLKLAAAMAPPEAAGPMAALKNAGPGKDYLTVTVAPAAGAAEFKVNIPTGGIQQIVQTFQGGMGAGPK